MRDINFFEPYIEGKRERKDTKFLLYIIPIFLVFSVAFYLNVNNLNESKLEEISKIESKQEQLELELAKQKEELKNLQLSDDYLTKVDRIDEVLIEDITSRVPDNVLYTEVYADSSSIDLFGISKDVKLIVDYGSSLKELKGFDDIFVANAKLDDESYEFLLNLIFEEISTERESIEEDGD